jgi:protein-S-isoprenylcysteine O-methyltransferase Ste14
VTIVSTNLPLHTVQRIRKAVLLTSGAAALTILPFVGSSWSDYIHGALESIGIALIVVAIAGRAWCSLYIGGKKLRDLVTTGPYSINRNPLYLFTFMGVFGVGLQTGAILPAVVLAALTTAVFAMVVPHEERALHEIYGAEYDAYRARVPRYWPRFANWRDSRRLVVDPATIRRTVADALPLLIAYPVMELFEYLQDFGIVGTIVSLY